MTITGEEAVRHLEDVVRHYEAACENKKRREIGDAVISELYVRLRAALFRLAPLNSEYASEARDICSNVGWSAEYKAVQLYGVAKSLKRDYEQQFISATFAALVRADVFDDFLEMADHLLTAGYKDPAAVIVGAVLEEHLRKLCAHHAISIVENGKSRKADSLNNELGSKSVYSKLDQKSVTAWQDLRNKAAHGEFTAYSDAQVDLMLKGVRDFVSRYPA